MSRHNRDLYQVSFKHVKPQQVGEDSSDYYLRSNKHQDVVCRSFTEALDAASTGMNDYVITGVRRLGPVIVVGNQHDTLGLNPTIINQIGKLFREKDGAKATPDIDVKVGSDELEKYKGPDGLTD